MNYTRVNLLKKSERRYQGAVSKRFILLSLVIAPVLVVGVLGMIKTIQYRSMHSNLISNREIWQDLEPRLSLYKDEMKGLQANQNLMAYFENWEQSQASMKGLLEDVQQTVPADIQFKRMSIRNNKELSLFKKPEEAILDYEMVIDGVSQGANSEYNVIELRKNLLQSDTVTDVFDSINLASMRKRPGTTDLNLREFRLEGEQLSGGVE